MEKIIETNNCGFCVDPKNPRAIAKAVEYLINHPKEAQKMGENGKKAVAEKYNWHNESKKLLALYEKINEIQKQ
jgi:Glycosyltransferase